MRFQRNFLVLFLMLAFAATASAMDSLITEYRGIFVGSTRDDVHAKLGKPEQTTDAEDVFEFADSESARIFFTEDKKVRAIVITYAGKALPTPNEIVGEAVTPRDDGGMYKMVRIEQQGFWVSYVKIAGDEPSVIVTVQAINKVS